MAYNDKRIDYLMTVAEEINLMTGLKAEVKKDYIEVDTIAGKIKFHALFGELMQDVYRFIYVYGGKLHNYGLRMRISYEKQHNT